MEKGERTEKQGDQVSGSDKWIKQMGFAVYQSPTGVGAGWLQDPLQIPKALYKMV
jgi:hypothetical protein